MCRKLKMIQLELPWGSGSQIKIALPQTWRVVTDSAGYFPEPIQDLIKSIIKNLDHPIESQPLWEFVNPNTRIALVMDDNGRPTPVNHLAPIVLDYLLSAGASQENITGLFAIGTHDVMSAAEMASRAGSSVFDRIRCMSIDCRDQEKFVYLGRTKRGTPVWINRIAVEADLRILIGTIEPHPQAGFGGGYKNLLPGLAGADSIAHNHMLLPSPCDYNMVGSLPEDNPMRLDLEEAGSMLPGKTFLVNVVLNPSLQPVAVVCGDPIQAHRAGIQLARDIYGIKLRQRADVVVASSSPMDQDLRQGGKAILNVAGACRPGGVILAYLVCKDGLKNVNLPGRFPPIGASRMIARALGSRGIYFLTQHLPQSIPGEDRFMINLGLNILRDYHVLIYSPRLFLDAQGRLTPVIYTDQESMLEQAMKLVKKKDPDVAVFYHGGVSYPFLERVEVDH